jgi:hypothetical protein
VSKPTRGEMVQAAVTLLRRGLLASALPARLMDAYNLSPEAARELAWVAVRRWRAQRPSRHTGGDGGKESEKPRIDPKK